MLISPDVINRMIQDPRFESFGFVHLAKSGHRPACHTCRGRIKNGYNWNYLKQKIAQLPDAKKREMKELLGVTTVDLHYRNGRGKLNRIQF
jgi:hypothetical protein